jgi:hypothetical protein
MKMKVPGTMELDEEIVRGSAAVKLLARMSGKKLPTKKEADAAEHKLRIERELEKAGLGRLDTPREVNEVVDNKNDMMALRHITKHSIDQIAAHKSMLSNMGVIPTHDLAARATQQKKNRESLLTRLNAKVAK